MPLIILPAESFQSVHSSLQACVAALVQLDDLVPGPPDDGGDVGDREEADASLALPRAPCDVGLDWPPEVSPSPQLRSRQVLSWVDGVRIAEGLQAASQDCPTCPISG